MIRPLQRRVDPVRLWGGGLATMLVAVGVAVVGVLAIETVFSLPQVLRYTGEVSVGDKVHLATLSAIAALLATALLHVLTVSAPRAEKFFGWIVGLVVVLVILQELLTGFELRNRLAASALYLVIGIAIASLLHGVARGAVRYQRADDEGTRNSRDEERYYPPEDTRRFSR
ncbi:MAG: DUF6069 family protein [Streptosporangiales bacterium]